MGSNMPELKAEMTREELSEYLHTQVHGLPEACAEKRIMDAAFLLRDWVSAQANYPHRDLLILHWNYSVSQILRMLRDLEGGLWCGGCAYVFTHLLNAIGIPAAVYMYGAGDLSHETTIFGVKEGKLFAFYILDAYLNFHYTWSVGYGDGRMMSLSDMFRLIRRGEYNQIVRIDTPIKRRFVTSGDAVSHAWLFPDGAPEQPMAVRGENRAYWGAVHSVDKLLQSGSFRELADQARGSQDINTFMLDLMLVNPTFSRVGQSESYAEFSLFSSLVRALGKEPTWA